MKQMKGFSCLILAFTLAVTPVMAGEAAVGETEGAIAEMVRLYGMDQRQVEFEEDEAAFEGVWMEFEDGFRLYLPKDWKSIEVTDEEDTEGVIFQAVGEQEGLRVSFAAWEQEPSLEDIYSQYLESGATSCERLTINGIPCAFVQNEAEDYLGLTFLHPDIRGFVLTVLFTPWSERELGAEILCSLSPLE